MVDINYRDIGRIYVKIQLKLPRFPCYLRELKPQPDQAICQEGIE